MAYVKWLIDWYYYVICCGVQYYTLPVPIRKKIRQRKSILLHKSKIWSRDFYFRVSQIQIFFWKIAWGRGTSCLLVRQERLLYLSTILRNKSVSKSLVYSFNITQTPMLHIAAYYCGVSFQADFILNYFLSNVLKFPQISPNFLSNSPFSTSRLAGWNN